MEKKESLKVPIKSIFKTAFVSTYILIKYMYLYLYPKSIYRTLFSTGYNYYVGNWCNR